MGLRVRVQQHYPRIGEMTVTIGDPHTDDCISVIGDTGYSSEELNENIRKAKRKLAAELRAFADTLEK